MSSSPSLPGNQSHPEHHLGPKQDKFSYLLPTSVPRSSGVDFLLYPQPIEVGCSQKLLTTTGSYPSGIHFTDGIFCLPIGLSKRYLGSPNPTRYANSQFMFKCSHTRSLIRKRKTVWPKPKTSQATRTSKFSWC